MIKPYGGIHKLAQNGCFIFGKIPVSNMDDLGAISMTQETPIFNPPLISYFSMITLW
jgi:hypothetical protein